jgi:hypothetical protein
MANIADIAEKNIVKMSRCEKLSFFVEHRLMGFSLHRRKINQGLFTYFRFDVENRILFNFKQNILFKKNFLFYT